MTIIALSILFCAATMTTVQGILPSHGHVYRNDHSGARFQNLQGTARFQLNSNYLKPYPILGEGSLIPHTANDAVIEVSEDDAESNEDESYADDDHNHAEGHGSNYGEHYEHAHRERGGKGHHIEGQQDESAQGSYANGHHEGYTDNADGEAEEHHDEADDHGKFQKQGNSYSGSDHGHKKHHSKGVDVTGYHKVFNKDELKKDHHFYDYSDNAGRFHKHGSREENHKDENVKHEESAEGESEVHNNNYGKTKFHEKGLVDESEEGHSGEEGQEKHYNDESEFERKTDNSHKNGYGYHDEKGDEERNYES